MGVLVVGCAGKKEPASTVPDQTTTPVEDPSEGSEGRTISPAAARIYMLGEERYAQGRFDEAVALWGHAMLQLPADPSADSVRHKLVARMGYGLLQAHQATGDFSYLEDGQAMCELYVAKHEDLFGDGAEAREQRGEIYELLYEFDSRLDGVVTETEADREPEVAVAEPLAPPASAEPEHEPETQTEHGENYRLVRVRRIAWADPDDPRVRAFLRDPRFTGPSMLDHGQDQVHGPRVLVRVGAVPRPGASGAGAEMRAAAREAGMAVVDAARPALERCYEVAMARDPVIASRVEVTLTVNADGTVTQPKLVDGAVVDAEGDVCTIEALERTTIDVPKPGAVELAMPVHFFYQDAAKTVALFRRERPSTGRAYELTSRTSGLPPIDEFMSSEPAARLRMIRRRGMAANDPRRIRGEPMADPGDIRD